MVDPNFIYDPPEGHNNTVVFKTNPAKEETRGYMQRLHGQTRDFINNTLIVWIKATFTEKTNVLTLDNTTAFTPDAAYKPATKKYVDDTAFSKTIPVDSVTDAYLSSLPGNVKDTVNAHMAENTNYKRVTSMGGMA